MADQFQIVISGSVIVALTGLPIGYSVIVTLTGLPIGYSVIAELEIAVGHRPFSDQFTPFGRANPIC